MGRFDRQAQSRPKHGPPTDSGASKAAAPPPSGRPAWRGSGLTNRAPRRKPQPSAAQNPAPTLQRNILPIDLQQLILNIFRITFPASQDFDALKPLLGEINDALLKGDLGKALGTEQFREGYAIRWSPSRALVYANVLLDVCDEHGSSPWVKRLLSGNGGDTTARAICFGGSAAEVMAMAGVLRYKREDAAGKPSLSSPCPPPNALVDVHLVDAADWSVVVSELTTGLGTAPELSKYATAAAHAKNASFLSLQVLRTKCTKTDILDLSLEDLQSVLGSDATLITLLFTLNDLYNTSIRRATSFLRKLSTVAPKGCLLLVSDAHEAISTADSIENGQAKTYPMSWLLDKALLPDQVASGDGPAPAPLWEKLVTNTNKVFKFPEKGLSYPAGLENMRFQVHLFKRL